MATDLDSTTRDVSSTNLLGLSSTVSSRFFPLSEETTVTSSTAPDDNAATLHVINYIAYDIIANIIVGIGIFSNILNLIVLTRPKLKGVMYVYLLGLAVSNLCVLVTAIPALTFASGKKGSQSYSTAFFVAHFEIPMLNSFMAASVYIIICMTVNRYISIYHPTHFQRIHTFKNAYIAIAASFAGGVLLHIPLTFYQKIEECPEHRKCLYEAKPNKVVTDHQLYDMYTFISEALLRFAPIITLTILNILIIVRFNRIARKREVLKGAHRGSTLTGNGNAAKTPVTPVIITRNLESTGMIPCDNTTPRHSSIPNGNTLSVNGNTLSVNGHSNGLSASTTCIDPENRTNSTALTVFPDPTTTNGNKSESALQEPSNGCSHYRHHRPSSTPKRNASHRVSTRRRGLHSPEERMLVVVLIAIVVLFVICTTPAAFLSIFYDEAKTQTISFTVFRALANNLELLGFALNFFVYCLCSADIRRAFVDVLFDNLIVRCVKNHCLSSKLSTNGDLEPHQCADGQPEVSNVLALNPNPSTFVTPGAPSVPPTCGAAKPPVIPSGIVVNNIVIADTNSIQGEAV